MGTVKWALKIVGLTEMKKNALNARMTIHSFLDNVGIIFYLVVEVKKKVIPVPNVFLLFS